MKWTRIDYIVNEMDRKVDKLRLDHLTRIGFESIIAVMIRHEFLQVIKYD